MAFDEELHPSAVAVAEDGLRQLLQISSLKGATGSINRPLVAEQVNDKLPEVVDEVEASAIPSQSPVILETAARKVFYDIVKRITVDQAEAQQLWTFLDLLLLVCEYRQSGRSIIWYLIEELVESQTADKCRLIFDYLDVRRERLTQREFQVTHLIILRTCNELLRRLSRAEDATFCGRVFFFLFQIFPLGEQSSVNLRGEFHIDNVTLFEEDPNSESVSASEDAMDTDPKPDADAEPKDRRKRKKSTSKKLKRQAEDINKFYQVFWRLQRDFSTPLRLTESEEAFSNFKAGLESTITKFSNTTVVKTKSITDESRGTKRKRGQDEPNDYQGNYNPKYLTSKDLFELELSDLSFQRHILVQALILLDFLLSLSEQAQKKIDVSGISRTNSSVNYAYRLSEEKKAWVQSARAKIAGYLQQGPDGNFYYRMVSTVLARDKNWIWWKIQKCPPIVADAVPADDFIEAKKAAANATANRRMRARPMGAMDLTFLSEADGAKGLDKLKDPARFSTPSVPELLAEATRSELDLDFAEGEEKQAIQAKIDSVSWRAIRATSRTMLSQLDKLDPTKKIAEQLAGVPEENSNPTTQEVDNSTLVEHKTPEVQVA
ncbi:THO complex, subunit THOC1 [Elsinoe ampelina]|uniref:THO complex, subunit THOC1 n=1 Tax=Elsinoe ampelina TaxID=302913 RepID=A0A6A6GKJ5_9PEZI|nr:THO complex, subunit THOC1 [Elsinoe ampelina]